MDTVPDVAIEVDPHETVIIGIAAETTDAAKPLDTLLAKHDIVVYDEPLNGSSTGSEVLTGSDSAPSSPGLFDRMEEDPAAATPDEVVLSAEEVQPIDPGALPDDVPTTAAAPVEPPQESTLPAPPPPPPPPVFSHVPIAVCGIGLRLPGGIRDTDAFWDVLYHGKDLRGPIPPSRFNIDGFDFSLGRKGSIGTHHGYFLDDDLACLDTSFFSMGRTELEKMDPQERQMLEVTRECLENAGEVDYRGRRVGCYVGTFGDDWERLRSKEGLQNVGGYNFSADLVLANRVSYEFNFKGPSMVIKTGCSASLVGLHEACRALQAGDCDAAIVAGSSVIMSPTIYSIMTSEGILSPEGSCKTFDAKADGFARAEGINAIYVKRLDDAVRDGNPIRAVVRNSGTNSDGKSKGLLSPDAAAQEALIRQVYHQAGLDPALTAFMECHGTGTATGDPIETTAVGNVFGDNGIYIGSVKPNVGHSEGASGLTSLIKSILALENKTIPPNIKFSEPNPKIPFTEKKLEVPVQPAKWPAGRAERISVNSFGIGGTNAHVILESVASVRPDLAARQATTTSAPGPQLLVLSANNQESLKQLADKTLQYARTNPAALADMAYTLSQRREVLPHRAYIVAGGAKEAAVSPFNKVTATAEPPNVVMVFTGQGAQWPQMGVDLLDSDPAFREDVAAMNRVLQGLKNPPSWSIEAELRASKETSKVYGAELSQPLCTAVQVGLVNALRRRGVTPAAVIGHSSGEIGAAYAAGAVTLREAVTLAYYRGFVTRAHALKGAMAAVGLGAKDVATFLVDGVVVAAENSPQSSTVSGDAEKVDEVLEKIRAAHPDGVLARKLAVNVAYHSHHMTALAERYLQHIREELGGGGDGEVEAFTPRTPQLPFFSTVHAAGRFEAPLDLEYWPLNLTSPVKFCPAAGALLGEVANPLFLEVGPHSQLAGPLRQICADRKAGACSYVPAMLRFDSSAECLLAACGQLFQRGVRVDFTGIAPGGKVLHDLPTYPWDHSARYWYESRVSADWRHRRFGHHALLGQRIPESTSLEPAWRVVLDLEDEGWLHDHRLRDDIVFPFAGYIAMAGEAIRQISGVEVGYSVQHVIAHNAMLLFANKPAEIITTLKKHRLTDSTDSEYFEFAVTSYTGSTWIKNCDGLVKPLTAPEQADHQIQKLPRKVSTTMWYDILARAGLVFGPEFKRLQNVQASPVENRAVGEIVLPADVKSSPYALHPTAIDAALQLTFTAKTRGAGKAINQLMIPSLIEQVDVFSRTASSGGGGNILAEAWSLTDPKEDVGATGVDGDGRVALRIRGMRLAAIEEDSADACDDVDRHAAARMQWFPDFDFADMSTLFDAPPSDLPSRKLLEELTLYCLLDSEERVRGLEPCQPHFDTFRRWLVRERGHAEQKAYPILGDVSDALALTAEERRAKMRELSDQIAAAQTSEAHALREGLLRVADNIEDIFTGKTEVLQLLLEGNVLAGIYDSVSFGFRSFVRSLSLAKAGLRILEVGAGTGGTTDRTLRDLVAASTSTTGGNPPYALYTFTDVSAGFFPQARARFAYAPNMEFKVFDITQDPLLQGFEPASYDLVLASNVVHATPVLAQTLSHLRALLKPDGHLALCEACAEGRAAGYVYGNFPGWWMGAADDRVWEPYVPVPRWDAELKRAGFEGIAASVTDYEEPYQLCAAIVARAAPAKVADARDLTVLCADPESAVVARLVEGLEAVVAGRDVRIVAVDDIVATPIATDRPVVVTLDLEGYFFEAITPARFAAFQALCRAFNSSPQRVLWLMRPTQVACADPRSAQSVGALRVVRQEMSMELYMLELAVDEPGLAGHVQKVLAKACAADDTSVVTPEREFAVRDGTIMLGRLVPFSLAADLASRGLPAAPQDQVRTLEVAKPGMLESLRWAGGEHVAQLGESEVEIETKAVGLNFRDMVVAMGVISFANGAMPFGVEASGVVTRVGSRVASLSVGDRVVGVAAQGCFGSYAVMHADMVVPLPDELGFDEAATMPAVFVTALYSLVDVGGLKPGQSVLIHSACGGVGHAAVQICKLIGADIYLTVGSPEKVEYAEKNFFVPRSRIFNSRDDSFHADLMRATDGRGVDVVLNSLSGKLLHATWRCVAEFGRMVEISKRDLMASGRLDLEPFLLNRTYTCVDIAHMGEKRPEVVGGVLKRVMDMYADGFVHPIHPMHVFPAKDVERAFRHMQKGDHIGKVVVSFEGSPAADLPTAASPSTRRQQQNHVVALDPAASYLITGGLGGLGRSLATWMAERGATSLVFLSRSAGKQEDLDFFDELAAMGCTAVAVAGKAQDPDAVKKAVACAPNPIKGVIHFAMLQKENNILDMSYSDWTDTVSPKVDGAWNLHHELSSQPLDFFLLASSILSVSSQPGLSNYAAANCFLESFCQFRRGLGLPASVLGICVIADIGFVANLPSVRRKLTSQGYYFLPERELLDFLEHSIVAGKPGPDELADVAAPVYVVAAEETSSPLDPPSSTATELVEAKTAAPPAELLSTWRNPGYVVMGLHSDLHLDDPRCQATWRRDPRTGSWHNRPRASAAAAASASSSSSSDALQAFLARARDDPDTVLAEEAAATFLARQIGRRVATLMMKEVDDDDDEEGGGGGGLDVGATPGQLGMDSLMAIELRRWWKLVLGLDVSVLEIMGSGTLLELGKVTAERLRAKLAAE